MHGLRDDSVLYNILQAIKHPGSQQFSAQIIVIIKNATTHKLPKNSQVRSMSLGITSLQDILCMRSGDKDRSNGESVEVSLVQRAEQIYACEDRR